MTDREELRPDALIAWLEEQRKTLKFSHDDLADAVGGPALTRRQTIRWLTEGTVPRGYAVIRLLDALGVRFQPPLPEELPRAVNSELAEIRRLLLEERGEVAVQIEAAARAQERRVGRRIRRLEQLLQRLIEQRPPGAGEATGESRNG